VGFSFAPRKPQKKFTVESRHLMAVPQLSNSRINIDLIAVAIALTLAALIRFDLIPPIGF
jgi:uncharacterized membrane protein